METKIKVSVVMPAYNCGDLIGETLDSVLSQTLKEIECIVVNDGSTDHTLSVLEKYQKQDGRLKIFTIENGGPAKARNFGMKQAAGEYVYFMDSDDLIHLEMLGELYSLASEKQLDICACGYTMESVDAKSPQAKPFLFHSFVAENSDEFRKELMSLIKAHLMYVVWNKLFSKAFLEQHQIQYRDYLSGEDRMFNCDTFPHVKRFGFINKPFYRYFLRGQKSLANRYVANRFEASLENHKALINAYQKMNLYDNHNQAYIDFVFIKGVMSCVSQLNAKGCPLKYKEKMQVIEDILKHPLVQAALNSSDDEVSYSKKVVTVLKSGNKTLIYLMGKAIFIMQFKLNKLYLNLKHRLKSS